MKTIDNKKFDLMNFKVTAFTDRDWEYLKADWERNNSYEDNEKGNYSIIKNSN